MTTGKEKKIRRAELRIIRGARVSGMTLDLSDQDRKLLVELVKRYQKQVGPAFKFTGVFVIRQLLRHVSAMRKLPQVQPDGDNDTEKTKNSMVVELETEDTARLMALVERYEKSDVADGYRISKAFVIRQLLRHAADLKEMPPLRGQ